MKSKTATNIIIMAALGLISGVISRLLDIYTQSLGNMFSELSIWILICSIIAIYSKSDKTAMINVPVYCIGMIIAYYITAVITNGVYSKTFIIGWSIFSLFTPIMAYLVRFSKRSGVIPKLTAVGVIVFSVLSSIIIFDGPRVYDYLITVALIVVLFVINPKKTQD